MPASVRSLITLVLFTGGCAGHGGGPTVGGRAAGFARPPALEDLELEERVKAAVTDLDQDFKLPFSRNWFTNRAELVWWRGYGRVARAEIRARLVVIRDGVARRLVLRPLVHPGAKPDRWNGLEFQLNRARDLIAQVDLEDEVQRRYPGLGCYYPCD